MGYLGELHRLGYGVSVNFKTAMSWYEKSAAKQSYIGYTGLGILYLNGQGCEIDYHKALAVRDGNKLIVVCVDIAPCRRISTRRRPRASLRRSITLG